MLAPILLLEAVRGAHTFGQHGSLRTRRQGPHQRSDRRSTGHHYPLHLTSSLSHRTTRSRLTSTPFDLDLYEIYDGDGNDDGSTEDASEQSYPLSAPSDTRLVLGLNKYSHDTTLCAASLNTGEVLFACSKERLTRKKHDGGNTAGLVETCLDQLGLDVDCIERVVMNNHHHRILPFVESNVDHMEWEEGLGINAGNEDGYSDEYNLLSGVENKIELSHHLAHAYSAASQSPFDSGLIVVMDGMGETYRTMKRAAQGKDTTYFGDLNLCEGMEVQFVPDDIDSRARESYFDWREAESVYTFSKSEKDLNIKPVFKRFQEEKTPPTLYNHGFENMDSLGAVYSRASSHIFGDWNACGKVMGLAPWKEHSWDNANMVPPTIDDPILSGSLYEDDGLRIDRSTMVGQPLFNRIDPDMFDSDGNMFRTKRYDFDDDEYIPPPAREGEQVATKQIPTKVALDAISLASRVQSDLETVAMDFVRHFKEETGESNLCLAGGVALNSVLNGRLSRELDFEKTFIPPYPGDDGVAVGCCAYGLYGELSSSYGDDEQSKLWSRPLSPYQGPLYTEQDIEEAIEWAAPWLDVEVVEDETARNDAIVEELVSGGVVSIYDGRSEMGPRALGHRSILADPRKKGLVRFINEFVKKRESFRPFAPSCLAEEAGDWFDLGQYASEVGFNVSPYMSITAQVREGKRDLIPAVTHVDGSSRLQTVTPEAEPAYHRLISAFFKATGVPMVLNTSFNTLKSEPITETPRNAIRTFLSSMGSIEMLILGNRVIKRKGADVRVLLGEERIGGKMTPPSNPKRAGVAHYKSTFSAAIEGDSHDGDYETKTAVQMPDRPVHDERDGGWFELTDDLEGQLLGLCDGTVSVSDIVTGITAMTEEDEQDFSQVTDSDQVLVENIIRRLVRMYEHTLISW